MPSTEQDSHFWKEAFSDITAPIYATGKIEEGGKRLMRIMWVKCFTL